QKQTTTNTTGGASLMGSFPTPRNGILSIDYEFILILKKLGTPAKVSKAIKDQSKMTTEEWKEYFSGHWNFGGARQDGHIAMFPEELPRRLIKMFAFKGETVLDPFMGSGTTAVAARNLERNSIGYEINPEFIAVAKQKLNIRQSDISGTTYEFLKDTIDLDVDEEFEKLPYRFVDFQNLDKKADPKKLQFGSKIDKDSGQREEYYAVKEIISAELIKLNNGLVVRLIGVKEKKNYDGAAKQFLHEKTNGQKVFMKFDSEKYDDQNNLMCYLYLKNKTFLNAHLIKEGLADPDTERDFRYRDKFLDYAQELFLSTITANEFRN
ncbi:MAG: DNA methyltransferase, partial [Bacteroidales bacterium]|nr:DNA methyltransferase [Bacteroidales bacterium]